MTAIDELGESDRFPWGLFDCADPHHEAVEVQGFDEYDVPDTYAWWRLWNAAITGSKAAIDCLAMLRVEAPSEFELIVMFNLAPGDYEVDAPYQGGVLR